MLRYQHFAHFPASGSLSSYMHLPRIQTSLKTLTLDEIAFTLREIRYIFVPQEHGLFSSPIWTQIFERDSWCQFCLPSIYASLDFGVVCKVHTKCTKKTTKRIKNYYALCDTTVTQSIIYIYLTNNIKTRSHSFILHYKKPICCEFHI